MRRAPLQSCRLSSAATAAPALLTQQARFGSFAGAAGGPWCRRPRGLAGAAPLIGLGPLLFARRPQSSDSQDYYAVLGVRPDATQDEIKSAYKKLALQFHPDRNHAPGAEEKFKTISAAYNVVGNKDQRRDYDMQRASFGGGGGSSSSGGFKQPGAGVGYSGGGFPGGKVYGGFPGTGGYQQMSKEEADRLFREIFGGMRVDQIFRDLEEEMQRSRGGQGAFTNAGPFFHQGTSSKAKIFTDKFGNRMEEHVYTDPSGRRFTVNRTSSTDPNASMNQTTEDYNSSHTSRKDGRVHFGNSSHNYQKPNMDFTDHYMGFRSHGRSPIVAFLSIAAWFVVIATVFSGFFYIIVHHPYLTLAIVFLIFLGRRGRL